MKSYGWEIELLMTDWHLSSLVSQLTAENRFGIIPIHLQNYLLLLTTKKGSKKDKKNGRYIHGEETDVLINNIWREKSISSLANDLSGDKMIIKLCVFVYVLICVLKKLNLLSYLLSEATSLLKYAQNTLNCQKLTDKNILPFFMEKQHRVCRAEF